jgi:hypothetical protein
MKISYRWKATEKNVSDNTTGPHVHFEAVADFGQDLRRYVGRSAANCINGLLHHHSETKIGQFNAYLVVLFPHELDKKKIQLNKNLKLSC